MKQFIYLSSILFLYSFVSCSHTHSTKEEKITPLVEITNTESLPKEAGSIVQKTKNFPPTDSIVFDESYLNNYLLNNPQKLTEKEYQYYQTEQFVFAPKREETIFLLDSIKFIDKNYYTFFFAVKSDQRITSWIVNYTYENQYIDSRRVYHETPFRYASDNFYAVLYPEENKIHIYDPEIHFYDSESNSLAYKAIPVIIYSNGKFEEYPEKPFSSELFAIETCSGKGLKGKFPPKEKWSVMQFYAKPENFIQVFETQNNYLNELFNENTLFELPEGKETYFFYLAIKGEYTHEEIEKIEMQEEDITAYPEITELVLSNAPLNRYTQEDTERKIGQLKSYIHKGQKYWFTKLIDETSFGPLETIIGIDPQNEIYVLADACAENTHLFRLNEKIILYTVAGSCGEGAWNITYLYELESQFKLIYQQKSQCD